MRRWVVIAIAAAVLLAGSTLPGTTAPAKVRFMVANPVINLGHTHLAVAQKRGYFKDADVDVDYLTSDGTVAVVRALASGATDMGQADTLSIAAALAQGVDEVVAVCSYLASNVYWVLAREDSPIQKVADLKGKKIGIASLGTGLYYNARVMLQDAGLSPERDVEFVTIAQPAAQLDALNKGAIDAVSTFDTILAIFQNQGARLRLFSIRSGPMQWQWGVVAARKAFLEKNRPAVTGVCKAIQQAELYVRTSPKAALRVFKEWGGDVGTTPEEHAINIIRFRADSSFVTRPEGGHRWGWLPIEPMDELADLYFRLGLLKSKVGVKHVYSNALLDQIQPDERRARSDAEKDAR